MQALARTMHSGSRESDDHPPETEKTWHPTEARTLPHPADKTWHPSEPTQASGLPHPADKTWHPSEPTQASGLPHPADKTWHPSEPTQGSGLPHPSEYSLHHAEGQEKCSWNPWSDFMQMMDSQICGPKYSRLSSELSEEASKEAPTGPPTPSSETELLTPGLEKVAAAGADRSLQDSCDKPSEPTPWPQSEPPSLMAAAAKKMRDACESKEVSDVHESQDASSSRWVQPGPTTEFFWHGWFG
eukprot:TRINITY_DN22748_c0_g1_i1.p1 TRINITY_DN22748_c0_g1~~TRINITY_DN22748_c0_g1_i1.p1  ORF type:complete len:243 (-),score=54.87 TRINITY_DN22748_c0_g1_i1:122-850(-)